MSDLRGQRHDVVVIGAGVVGLATAIALAEAGRGVCVIDAGKVGSGASHGNCGTITPSHAVPFAAPGAIGRALRWMWTPGAPLYIPPRLDPALWRWLAGVAMRCNARDWNIAMQAKAALLRDSRLQFPEWIARHGLDCEFVESGVDYVFRDARALEAFAAQAGTLAAAGIASQVVAGDAAMRDDTSLLPGTAGVVRFDGDAQLRPDRYVAELARTFRALGGRIVENCTVTGLAADGRDTRVQAQRTQADAAASLVARDVVVATGAWSPKLARALQLQAVPIQPGKGYSIVYDRPARVPQRSLVLAECSVFATSWSDGFRLGSTMEFSGYDASLDPRRLDALERGATQYLAMPLGQVRREAWCGWRPMCVDDVPMIGRVPGQAHRWLATGHGMLGVSMSIGSGQLLADVLTGRQPRIDPAPYDPARFAPHGRQRRAPAQVAAALP